MRSSKAFYFLFFSASACLIPFLTLHYQGLGLTGQQIGFLAGIVPLITLVTASTWGAVADAKRRHHLLLLAAISGLWLSVLALSRAATFTALIPIVCLYAIFMAPIVPLVDNSVMTNLGARKAEYGRIRVWGSYGWGVTAAIIGVVVQRSGLSWIFAFYLALVIALLLVGMRLPVRSVSIGGTIWQGIRALVGDGRWLLFLAVALVEGMSLNIFLSYLFLHLREMGASGTVMGLSLTVATVSEIPIFLYSRKLLARWGAPALLAISIAGTVVRAFAYAAMSAPWQVLPISLLHGPTFAAMWAAGVAYADAFAPAGLGATAQGMFGSAVFGLGAALGAFTGGYLYDAYGGSVTFQWVGWMALAALLIFIWANRGALLRRFWLRSSQP